MEMAFLTSTRRYGLPDAHATFFVLFFAFLFMLFVLFLVVMLFMVMLMN